MFGEILINTRKKRMKKVCVRDRERVSERMNSERRSGACSTCDLPKIKLLSYDITENGRNSQKLKQKPKTPRRKQTLLSSSSSSLFSIQFHGYFFITSIYYLDYRVQCESICFGPCIFFVCVYLSLTLSAHKNEK